ncbi:MAG: hypothetical protein PHY43_13155 [Verrucomicrobiales bacterium]|nr:hypothetical protein [Verrucomicrobiales bacterium]
MSLFKLATTFNAARNCPPLVCGICLFSSLTFSQGAEPETNSYPSTSNLYAPARASALSSNHMNTASLPNAALGSRPVPAPSSSGFTNLDVGSPRLGGSTKPVAAGWDILGGGADIWGKSDQFHFVFKEMSGDFDIAIRVESFTPAHLYSKAGLMIRETLEANSPHLMFFVFSGNAPRNNNLGAYELQFRSVAGSNCQSIYPAVRPPAPPEFPAAYPNSWLRVERRGNHFLAFASTDGKTWKLYAEHDLALASTVKVGPALTSHNPQLPAKAAFRNYTESK